VPPQQRQWQSHAQDRERQALSPESPFLYSLNVRAGNDEVSSYFGMRKISLGKDASGITRIFLNNQPYFQHGPLDQGFWPDGLYTAPTDDASAMTSM